MGGIDCDIHPALPGMAALLPYLDAYWREQVTVRGIDGLDLASYPPGVPANARPDWRHGLAKPGTDLDHVRRDVFDGFGVDVAICHVLYGIQALPNPHMATAFAAALNDWLAAEWLDREPRLRASITVAAQDPARAAEEIERRAGDPRFVGVLMLAMGSAPLGQRAFWPIHEAAARHGLPVCVHAGSIAQHATTSNGWPSTYLEDTVVQAQAFQSQLLSLIHEGVFVKFPALRVVLLESGFTWMPNFMWRANRTWRAMRAEVPWVDRPPADIIRDHVSISLQPGDGPPDAGGMARVLDQIGADDMVVFATDYPHHHFDGADPFPAGFPEALRARVRHHNPQVAFPRLQEVFA